MMPINNVISSLILHTEEKKRVGQFSSIKLQYAVNPHLGVTVHQVIR